MRVALAIRETIATGRLRAGDRLPPSRALAQEIGTSRWVVVEAYEQLKAEGYLVSRSGAATRVADLAGLGPKSTMSVSAGSASRPRAGRAVLDLSPAVPDLARFPRASWKRAYNHALRDLSDPELGYPSTNGLPRLRESVASYLRRVRGMDVLAGEVQVTQGTSQGIRHVFRLLAESGRSVVATEDPCWPRVVQTARDCGMTVRPIPVDGGGIDVSDLMTRSVEAVYLTPAHQFPTGAVLDAGRRNDLLRWAAAEDVLLIEDDYDAELRYDRRPIGPLAAVSRHNVAYLGSVSKAMAPALRIGWMVLPSPLRAPMTEMVERSRTTPGAIDQQALAEVIDSGIYERHLRGCRREFGRRRQELIRLISDAIPCSRIQEPAAGLHLVLELPSGVTEAAVVDRLRRHDIVVQGMSSFRERRSPPQPQALLVGFGQLAMHRLADFVRILAASVDGGR